MTTWTPSQRDVNWMRRMFSMLRRGGVWRYTDRPLMFRKVDGHTMALIAADESFPGVTEQIERSSRTIRAAGIVYKDLRATFDPALAELCRLATRPRPDEAP